MYLAIDLWDKRCWIAICIDGIVFPKDIVLRPKLIKELKKYISNYNIEVIVVAISIISALPFLFQRTTIWESPIFAFLFAPYIIDQIYKKTYAKVISNSNDIQ